MASGHLEEARPGQAANSLGRPAMKLALTVTVAALLAAAAPAASAQPPGAQWTGDVCHEGAPAPKPAGGAPSSLFEGPAKAAPDATSAHPIECLPYPPRIQAHAAPCHWVSDFYDGAAHAFEVCREGDGVWRPSGRS
jgi:hypothetical protein